MNLMFNAVRTLTIPAIALLASLALHPVTRADDSQAFTVAALRIENGGACAATSLKGGDARLQLVVSAEADGGEVRDYTRQVRFTAEPAGRVEIDNTGLVTPVADGEVTVTATLADDAAATGPRAVNTVLQVTGIGQEPPIHFQRQIIPMFTKMGCNGGGCHGKISGQNGFRLSLLGFEGQEDYDYLVKESRGRRISVANPASSLLLTKGTGEVPHGGGARMDRNSYEYRLMSRWIAQGTPSGDPTAPTVETIEIFPATRRLAPGQTQQLSVIARYSDGSVEDVTPGAIYESNDGSMAEVSTTGWVQVQQMVGDVAVMARFQGHIAVFNADIPFPTDKSPATVTDPAVEAGFARLSQPRNAVDTHVFAKLSSLGIPASPDCDDATFLRRLTLDIAGRLPTLDEVEQFANDPTPSREKRDRVIDRLLDSEDYAEHFAGKWGAILRNRRNGGTLQFSNLAFHDWIRQSLIDNKPYDQFVGELLTASGSSANNPAVNWFAQVPDLEQRTEDAAQLFLGQRIQCARCHHHPYEKWSQADYAQLAAFFSLVSKKPGDSGQEPEFYSRPGNPTAAHPKTGQPLSPTGLDGEAISVSPNEDPRVHLARWMVDPENPFFARSLANRYWKHFLGRGLVEPEDDMRVTNPPSNPALLDALAYEFVASGYDMKSLIRLICQSQTYSFSSESLAANIEDRRSHSRFYPKRLGAEVLLDSVDTVTQTPTAFQSMPAGTRAVALPDTGFGSYFLTVFGRPESTTACECERSQESNLAQSLHLLNSEEIQGKLASDIGRAAKMAAEASDKDDEAITRLYKIALSRAPAEQELKAVMAYVAGKENRRAAMEDVIWSLINSKEFIFNH
jgi:hypothetical protein